MASVDADDYLPVSSPDGKKPRIPFNETCPAYVPKHPELENERLESVARFNAWQASRQDE